MSITRFFVHDVVIKHPLMVEDVYGNARPDYDQLTEVATKGWMHRLSESDRDETTRDANLVTHVLRLPKDTSLTDSARVEWEGEDYRIEGRPWLAPSPTGPHHWRCPLRLVDG